MHIPDGFINAGVSAAAGGVAVVGVGYSLKRAKETLEEKAAPMAGLVAAFIFAVQMLNFPVAAGTSGHLLGGALAAILVGPWAGAICIAVVLMVQALFADGGLTALGLNIVNMALITSLGGYATFMLLRRRAPEDPRQRRRRIRGSGHGLGDARCRWVHGRVRPRGHRHGVGRHRRGGHGRGAFPDRHRGGLITAVTVGVVLGVRPDLVYGAQDMLPDLQLRDSVTVGS